MQRYAFLLISRWTLFVIIANARLNKGEHIFEERMMEPTDRSKWVNPLDMGFEELSDATNNAEVKVGCIKELNMCQNSHHKNNLPKDIFFTRHVKLLLNQIDPFIQTDDGIHVKLEVKLTANQLSLLQKYTDNGDISMVDIDEILSSYIVGVEQFNNQFWVHTLQHLMYDVNNPLVAVIITVIFLCLLLAIIRYFTSSKLMMILIIVSVIWNWIRLYKIRWASKHATLLSSGRVPPECHLQDMTWIQSLTYIFHSFVSTGHRCEEYHEAIMVDPFFEVNPLAAAVDLATNLLLHPLSRLGGETGAMFSSLLSSVPIFWKAPVLLVFLILLMFVMVLLAGYRVRLPLFLGLIEPSNRQQKNIHEELKKIKKTLQDLKEGRNTTEDVKTFLRLTCGSCHLDSSHTG